MTITPEMRQRVEDYILDLPRIINRPIAAGEKPVDDPAEKDFYEWLHDARDEAEDDEAIEAECRQWEEELMQMPAKEFRAWYLADKREYYHRLFGRRACDMDSDLVEGCYTTRWVRGDFPRVEFEEVVTPELEKQWAAELLEESYILAAAESKYDRLQRDGKAPPPTPEEARRAIVRSRRRTIANLRSWDNTGGQLESDLEGIVFRRALAEGRVAPIRMEELLSPDEPEEIAIWRDPMIMDGLMADIRADVRKLNEYIASRQVT